jgi:hypothetical protein
MFGAISSDGTVSSVIVFSGSDRTPLLLAGSIDSAMIVLLDNIKQHNHH